MKKYLIVLVGLLLTGLVFFIQPKPPLLDQLNFSQAIYDSHHQLLRLTLTSDGQYRLFIPLSAISPWIVQATLMKEDQNFYRHHGVDFPAVGNAIWQTYVNHHYRRGASTLTMQVARLRYRLNTHTIWGKLRQILLALELERYYSKKQILEAYFNLAPYGNNIQGVGAASLVYYHELPNHLTLPQALTLSVIPQNPDKRNLDQFISCASAKPIARNEGGESGARGVAIFPLAIPHCIAGNKLVISRSDLFQRWLRVFPDDKKYSAAIELPLTNFTRHRLPFLAPHFVDDILQNHLTRSGLRITTLDLSLQKLIENAVRQYIADNQRQGVHNAAVLLIDTQDMSVKALAGSADFFDKNIQGQVNGTLAKRSPGSALKPFIYALALDQGLIHPATVLKDTRQSFGDYNPENFDNDFWGPVTAKEALIMSRNIPALNLANQLKNPSFYQFLKQSGMPMKTEEQYGLTLALGGAEITMQHLVELYAMLANQGVLHRLRFTMNEPLDAGQRLLSPEASFLILDMLKDNPPPKMINLPGKIAISWKTGTSSGYRDAWAVGVVGHTVLAVWIGDFSGKGNLGLTGRDTAGSLFFKIASLLAHNSTVPMTATTANWRNLNLKKVAVCQASGMLPTSACPRTVLTWFIPGKSPIQRDTVYREVMINPANGLRSCHFSPHNQFAVYEFWSSDLLKIFTNAGIARRTPPPYEPGCDLADESEQGIAPKIISPKSGLIYTISSDQKTVRIPLAAVVDGDVMTLHWFVDQAYLGSSHRDTILWLTAKPGHYIVRVVDDHDRVDSVELLVNF